MLFFKREAALWIPVFSFILFETVIVAKLKLKSANLKVKWPLALYDFDKSRPLSRALHFKNNEPGLIKNCLLNRAEKRRFWTGFLGPILRQTSLNEQNQLDFFFLICG